MVHDGSSCWFKFTKSDANWCVMAMTNLTTNGASEGLMFWLRAVTDALRCFTMLNHGLLMAKAASKWYHPYPRWNSISIGRSPMWDTKHRIPTRTTLVGLHHHSIPPVRFGLVWTHSPIPPPQNHAQRVQENAAFCSKAPATPNH